MTLVSCPMCGDSGIMIVPDHHPECPGGGVICEQLCPIPLEVICDCQRGLAEDGEAVA